MRPFALPLIWLAAYAAPAAAQGAAPDMTLSVEFPPGDTSSTVILSNSEDRPVLAVRVNGSREYEFVLDSGASVSVVDHEIAAELQLPRDERVSEVTDSLGLSETVSFVRAERVTVGRVSFGNMMLAEVDLPHDLRDGVLGCDFLSVVRITLDPRAKRATIRSPESRWRPKSEGLTVKRDSALLPYVEGRIGGQSVWLLMDTGSGHALALSEHDAAACGLDGGGSSYYTAVASGFGRGVQPVGPLESLHIGGALAKGMYARIGGRRSLVGAPLLAQMRVTFDLAASHVYMEPYSRSAIDLNQRLCTGVEIGETEGGYLGIMSVAYDSPADREGLRAGMRITHINGTPGKEINRRFLQRLHERPDGSVITYGVANGRDRFEVELQKVYLR